MRKTILLAGILSTVCASHVSFAQSSTQSKGVEAPQKSLSSVSLDVLLKGLDDVKRRRIAEASLIRAVQTKGVAFVVTGDEIQKLKAAGASQRLLDAIQAASRPAPPAPPPPVPVPEVKEGLLAVSCAPVECTVFVGSQLRGKTTKGLLEGINQPEGTTIVQVQAEGFDPEPNETKLDVKAGDPIRVPFTLQPTRATLERVGAEHYAKFQQALGGEAGLKERGFLRASGNLQVYGRDGRPVPWSLTLLLKIPDQAKFTISRAGKTFEVASQAGGAYQWNKSPQGAEFQDLEDGLRLIRDYQFDSLMARLTDKKLKVLGTKFPEPPEVPVQLRFEGSPEIYSVTLDANSRPQEIKFESGLNAGRTILLADYAAKGKGWYPKTTQVILPGVPRRGVEIKYDTVELNPAGVKDADLKVRRGVSLGLK